MIISNVELAALVGKLTGNKNTAMAYDAERWNKEWGDE